MRLGSVLVVCIGNICRSPLGERLLVASLPEVRVTSAGLGALVGAGADPDAAAAAAQIGIDLSGHVARQLTEAIGRDHDLILAMEPAHRIEIGRRFPQLFGRVMLFSHWSSGQAIADPYRRGEAAHLAARDAIVAGANGWISRLHTRGRVARDAFRQ